ncbi:AbrB/MazE/SpoVT family DNA-binding domain-containing protein [Rhizobium sp. L1K21]|uniref:AbrB/MazE/SpoVT family DNA-binding domain-containing protein n=1 Tax=Rhizobium sp. L1K21 TaxID=2954933 RepID=UPI002092BE68|nr:AbrB/MazE/SpoVT family DNA-binding domain-containing protein [Rhizobium sp. L1K21]MCO6185068.1 AbrB/MazE/SpoVT family DNA-binding domain-containing protein [Rhizobium sp. L1K21]
MRVTSKGQVTIPRDLRELAGIKPNSEVIFSIENGKLVLAPKDNPNSPLERQRLDRLTAALDRLENTGDQAINADELMAMTRDRD